MLSTLVIVALQCLRKVLVFFWPTDCVSLDFFQGVWRGWRFLSFCPIIFFLFSPGGDSRYFYLLFLAVFFFSFFLVPWMLVDIRLVYIYIYIHTHTHTHICVCVYWGYFFFTKIYIYIYMCVCECVCVYWEYFYIYIYIYICVCVCVYIGNISILQYIYIYMCVHVCVCVCLYWGYFYIDTCGVMVTIVGNGHDNLSSNSGQGCLHFT